MPIIRVNEQMIGYSLKRSAKAKRLRLEYYLGFIYIVAPYFFSNGNILGFLFQKKKWLSKQISESAKREAAADLRAQSAETDNMVQMTDQSKIDIMERFKINVEKSVEKYSQLLNTKPKAVYLKTQRRRWGSCGIHNQIYINWRLMNAPLNVIEYVVLHECCHLLHRNHGPHFWALVEKHMPGYKMQEHWLRQHSNMTYYNPQEFIACQSVCL